MRERKRSLTFFLIALFIIGSLPITNSVSAEDEVDNWPENDAWLHIELISWSANETVEWDNNGGLPDPIFKVCIEADGDNLDCINTPTWENQMTLNNSWNYSIDIPDHTNILNITIECEDNDALNDDECDMNSELDEWKLYAEYNWSATPTLTVTGNGDGDGNDTWKNAASTWKFTIDGFGDEDSDGYSDNIDICPSTDISEVSVINGCSYEQVDHDLDGVPTGFDHSPFNPEIGLIEQIGFVAEYTSLDSWNQIPHPGGNSIETVQRIYLTDFSKNGTTDYVDSQDYENQDSGVDCVFFLFEKNTYICLHGGSRPAFVGVSSSTPILSDTGITPGQRMGAGGSLLFDEPRTHHYEGELGLGDLDMDGNIDLIFTNTNCYVKYGDGNGNFAEEIEIPGVDVCGMNSKIIDLDNDGDADLVNPYGYYIQGEDSFVKHSFSWSDGDYGYIRVKTTDYEMDGDIDIVFDLYPSSGGLNILGYALLNQANDDDDEDNVMDLNDECLNTGYNESVDEFGCSYNQKDDDNDGVSNLLDSCPNTPLNSTVNIQGCTVEDTQDLDSDDDGVLDSDDACPNTPADITVDSIGCDLDGNQTPDTDSDGDGVYGSLDDCANTPSGATVDFKGCPMDSDFDGVYDGIDECPSSNNPSPSDMDKSSEVDSTGCFIDAAGSESDSGSAAFGCLGMLVMVGMVVFVVRKVRSPRQEQVFYAQTQSVRSPVQQQFVSTPQISSRERELEHQSRQAQIEAQRLRQELANQAQFTQQLQSEVAQKKMSESALAQKQHELAVAQREKEELEAKLAEAEKNTPIVQNITYNIQDSAISGDITNKINRNDLE